jgi:hypothetical protein
MTIGHVFFRGPISLSPDSKSIREKVAGSIEGEGGGRGVGGGGERIGIHLDY